MCMLSVGMSEMSSCGRWLNLYSIEYILLEIDVNLGIS